MLDKELLKILACPKCQGDITYLEEKEVLICNNCRVYYEIKEGIPVMLPEEAKPYENLENT